jgi:hypothetical protein
MSVELENAKMNIKVITAQLDSAKQMINESLTTNLQLRTNLTLLSQAHQEEVNKNKELTVQLSAFSAPTAVEELDPA